MKSAAAEKKVFFALTFVMLKFVSQIISREIELGPCFLQYFEQCDNNSIRFFLFSSDRPANLPTQLDNLSPKLDPSEFVNKSFKMIIHGYGGHLDFNGSKLIRNGKAHKLYWLQSNQPQLRNDIGYTFSFVHADSEIKSACRSTCRSFSVTMRENLGR